MKSLTEPIPRRTPEKKPVEVVRKSILDRRREPEMSRQSVEDRKSSRDQDVRKKRRSRDKSRDRTPLEHLSRSRSRGRSNGATSRDETTHVILTVEDTEKLSDKTSQTVDSDTRYR